MLAISVVEIAIREPTGFFGLFGNMYMLIFQGLMRQRSIWNLLTSSRKSKEWT